MISKATAPHYVWGDRCDGWRLVQSDGLSVIHERMPSRTTEVRHYHRAARQFFFIVSGAAVMERGDERVVLRSGEGVEIPPGVSHRIRNESEQDVEFLVVSAPPSQGDRLLDISEPPSEMEKRASRPAEGLL